jgi:signal transduction histidine kinase
MRRRILISNIIAATVAAAVFAVPLSVVFARHERQDSFEQMDETAVHTRAALADGFENASRPPTLPHPEAPMSVALYRGDGTRLTGTGPRLADPVTASVQNGEATGAVGGYLVLAHPVREQSGLVGVIRVSVPESVPGHRARMDLLVLLGLYAAAVIVAGVVGWFVAARLARPVFRLRDVAVRIGDGDFAIDPQRSGIREIDETADALAETAERLEAMLSRERSFSADASHQLRNPLTALRLSLEAELESPQQDHTATLRESLGLTIRLQETVATLLEVTRGRPLPRHELDVTAFVDGIRTRWSIALSDRGRNLRCTRRGDGRPRVSRAVADQIVDVIVDNAVQHGAGDVVVGVEVSREVLSVTVADEGTVRRSLDELFDRAHPHAAGHGVGLYLARSLAEAEGGRLTVAEVSPATFRLILTDRPPEQPDDTADGSVDGTTGVEPAST